MSARHKLNSSNMYFCVMMAGLVGLLTGGRGRFAPAAVARAAASIHPGGIRLRPTGRRGLAIANGQKPTLRLAGGLTF